MWPGGDKRPQKSTETMYMQTRRPFTKSGKKHSMVTTYMYLGFVALTVCSYTMWFPDNFFFLLYNRVEKLWSRKLLGLWGALEAITFIWACRTNLAEKDDEAGFLILAFYLEILAKNNGSHIVGINTL